MSTKLHKQSIKDMYVRVYVQGTRGISLDLEQVKIGIWLLRCITHGMKDVDDNPFLPCSSRPISVCLSVCLFVCVVRRDPELLVLPVISFTSLSSVQHRLKLVVAGGRVANLTEASA